MFRDGIPLNENFFALKNKYKKDEFQLRESISNYENGIKEMQEKNEDDKRKIQVLNEEISQIDKEYHNIGDVSIRNIKEYK